MMEAPNFDRLAGVYRWMEFFSFGPWLGLTRKAFLKDLAHCRRALVLGDGDGRFTRRLLQVNHSVSVDAIDASSAMLQALVRGAGPDAHRVRALRGDLRAWQPLPPPEGSRYDLIATHFLLDCLTGEEIHSLAGKARSVCSPDALWIVSEFAIPDGWHGRLVCRPLVAFLYFSFRQLTGLRVTSLPDHATALRQAGFSLSNQVSRLGGLLVAQLWRIAVAPPQLH
jgi:ubiquinone/menaquinone biosynthesis C-methylase UbiE